MAADAYTQYLHEHGVIDDPDPKKVYRLHSFYIPPPSSPAPKQFCCKRCNRKIPLEDVSTEPDLCKPCQLVRVKPVGQVRSMSSRIVKSVKTLRTQLYDLKQNLDMIHPYTLQYAQVNADVTILLKTINDLP